MKKLINAGMAIFAVGLVSGCGTTAQTTVAQAAKPVEVAPATSEQAGASYDKPGFSTAVANGRLWVFLAGSPEWDAFKASGKGPAVHTVRPLAGPDRMTVLSPDSDTLVEYLVAKPGFHVRVINERLWVFAEGSKELEEFKASGKTPAVHTVRPRAGPMGLTVLSPDSDTLVEYLVAKPGFHVKVINERLWVFAEGSKELEEFTASGKTPAVHTVRPRAGPMGMTIIAPDGSVLDAYME